MNDEDTSLGKRIKFHRNSRGLTQESLSQLASIPYTTLTKIESGKIKNPSVAVVSKLANALNISLDNFSMVTTFSGESSLKRIHKDIIETLSPGDCMYISGIDEREFLKADKKQIESFVNKIGKLGLSQRLLSCEGDSFRFDKSYMEYRWIPREFFNPNPMYVYGNKIAAVVWGPPQEALILTNEILADAYRKQFLFMWENAKPFLD